MDNFKKIYEKLVNISEEFGGDLEARSGVEKEMDGDYKDGYIKGEEAAKRVRRGEKPMKKSERPTDSQFNMGWYDGFHNFLDQKTKDR